MSDESDEIKTILIVDDNNDVRVMIRHHVESLKCRVIEACNGQEAIEVVTRERPDLILMDLNMPMMDGLSAARAIRQNEDLRSIPIIAITAYGSFGIDFYSHVDDLGAAPLEYLAKPFDLHQLTFLINNLLRN